MEDSCDSQSARQSTSTTGPFWVAALLQIVSPFVLIPFGLSISKFASDSGNQFGGEIVNSAIILWLPLIVLSWVVYIATRSSRWMLALSLVPYVLVILALLGI